MLKLENVTKLFRTGTFAGDVFPAVRRVNFGQQKFTQRTRGRHHHEVRLEQLVTFSSFIAQPVPPMGWWLRRIRGLRLRPTGHEVSRSHLLERRAALEGKGTAVTNNSRPVDPRATGRAGDAGKHPVLVADPDLGEGGDEQLV